MSTLAKPILYTFWGSSCSWRVRIALHWKEIPYDTKPVNLFRNGGEQLQDEYTQINALQVVPALQIDGETLVESLNILYYLDETRPHKPLMPKRAIQRAKVRTICEMIVADVQPLQNLRVLRRVSNDEQVQTEWAQHYINLGFKAVEKFISVNPGKYCVGNEITLADCCLVPQVLRSKWFKVDMKTFPNILRVYDELKYHPVFIDTHPYSQPDCPPEWSKKKVE